jgi:hypothetical protein
LADAGVDDLESCIAQGARHDFGPAIMTIKPRLGNKHTDFFGLHS